MPKKTPKTLSEYHASKETFADKVRYAIANYAGLQATIREFNTWKYIIKDSYPAKRMRYTDAGRLIIEQRSTPENWFEIGKINRYGRATIGEWINK